MSNKKVIEKNVLDQYIEDMQQYSILVNRRRSVPDYRDGLKLVHRRILESMYNYNNCMTTDVKSAKIVGDVIGNLHPHGDSAVYETMKPLANWFEINMPLIDGHGNWGNFQGDGAAAMRYTEAKLSKFAIDCVIGEITENRNTVDLVPNFLGSTLEPEFFPVKLPLLLINGAYGIAVGMIVSVPKHNINEVIDHTIALIKNPNHKVVLIPDHCMKCEIIDTDWKKISNTGNGNYKVRGIIDIEEYNGKPALIIKSTPDLVFLDTITDKLEELIKENKLINIVELVADHGKKENSNNDNKNVEMRYIIVLKKGSDPNFIRDMIYKHTAMEVTALVNFEVLNGIELTRMSYTSYIQSFVEFRRITKFRLYCNRLQNLETKIHERDAYIKLLESGEVDKVIKMIKSSDTTDNELIEYLIKKIKITDLQAEFIINASIKKLSLGYLNKYKKEAIEYRTIADIYLNKITNDEFDQEIIDELLYYKKKYSKPRNCTLITKSDANNIPNGEFKVIITENNFVKKVHINDTIGSFRGDIPKHILKVENINNILIFDDQGKVFRLPVHKIPFSDKNSPGTDIRLIVKNLTSNINTILYEDSLLELTKNTSKHFLTVITNNGIIKKLDLEDFLTVPPSGILFVKLDNDDFVKNISIVHNKLDIIVYSDTEILRMKLKDVPHLKRNAKGVKSINTKENIDGLSIIYPNTTHIIIITENGLINKFDSVALPCIGRNKSGVKGIKLSKNDKIHSIFGVNDNNILRVITRNNRIDFPINEIEIGSSVSSGIKLLPMKGDNIIKCTIMKNK